MAGLAARRAGAPLLLGGLLLSVPPPARLPAQLLPNRAALYLHPTEVRDARAVWVNPAGLAVWPHASVHLDVTVGDPGERGRLRQITAGFSSRGLGFSYQRDRVDSGPVAHTYRVGLAGAAGGIAAGAVAAIYRGEGSATGWDVGLVYSGPSAATLGAVLANLGEPVIRGVRAPLTLIPAATVSPLGAALTLSAQAQLTRDSVLGYAFGVRVAAGARLPVTLLARLDTDRALRRRAFAFGLSLGGPDLIGAVVTTSGELRGVDAASLYGVAARPLAR